MLRFSANNIVTEPGLPIEYNNEQNDECKFIGYVTNLIGPGLFLNNSFVLKQITIWYRLIQWLWLKVVKIMLTLYHLEVIKVYLTVPTYFSLFSC